MQEVIRQLLRAYIEPRFSDHSHGFRPGRGCHTALSEIVHTWKGVHWFIEGDISDCFGSLSHEVLMEILSEHIQDNRFLRLIRSMLQAGYLEEWRWHETLSGAPQGGVCSPILSNIYLDKLDQFVERVLLPKYNQGELRRANPPYKKLERSIARAKKKGDRKAVHALRKQRRKYASRDPQDPNYRRLRYIRYADDWLLGCSGPKAEAEEIPQCWLVQPMEMGQRNVAAQNAGRQTQILGRCDGTQVQSNNRDEQWPEEVPQGGRPAWREETTGCTIWRNPLTTQARCYPR
jgi:hypothetical protein